MVKEQVLHSILNSNNQYKDNVTLLKKVLFTVYLGRLQINGQSPDSDLSLTDYLLDDERFILDLKLLSTESLTRFKTWLLHPHEKSASNIFLSRMTTNEYRGYTAETPLGMWGRFINFVVYKKKSRQWDLAPLELSLVYQLKGLEITEGRQGIVVGFNQLGFQHNDNRYGQAHNRNQLKRNIKRVHLTDTIVNSLLHSYQNHDIDILKIIHEPHPLAIKINAKERYYLAMKDYRRSEQLIGELAWYVRLWHRFLRWLKKTPSSPNVIKASACQPHQFQVVIDEENLVISFNKTLSRWEVKEMRPLFDTLVFSGGGIKIYGHVGAMRAIQKAGISIKRYAGSSAGAIMAVFCYLGYEADEIEKFFSTYNMSNLVFRQIDTKGISTTDAMKAALDFKILAKVNDIIIQNGENGRRFKLLHPLTDGKVTFSYLQDLKNYFPNCGIADELIVTATNVKHQKTDYFSNAHTPDMEVSQAIATSACFPIIYKPVEINGETYIDGGVLSNLPVEVFRDEQGTLLAAAYGNSLKTVAFQFNNGPEMGALHRMKRVYRENKPLAWFYHLMTGVKEAVSGFERDRIKLQRIVPLQTVLINAKVPTAKFTIDKKLKVKIGESGYQATMDYINTRFRKENNEWVNDEVMAESFSSFEELLCFCVYRGRDDLFEKLVAHPHDLSSERVGFLRQYLQYFHDKHNSSQPVLVKVSRQMSTTEAISAFFKVKQDARNIALFMSLYPIFSLLNASWVINPKETSLFKGAVHFFNKSNPASIVERLRKSQGEKHMLLYCLELLIENASTLDDEVFVVKVNQLKGIMGVPDALRHPDFLGHWQFQFEDISSVIACFLESAECGLGLCRYIKSGGETRTFSAIQPIITSQAKEARSQFDENIDNRRYTRDRASIIG